VLVTGAGRRVGRAIAEALAADGARVAAHAHRSGDDADALAHALNQARPGSAAAFPADLTDAAAAEDLPRRVAAHFGGLDVLINSAAVMLRHPFGTVTPAQWDQTHHLNLRAYFFVAQGAAPFLRRAGGAIVNMSDLAAFEPWPEYLPHCVSKAGVEMLTKGLARVLAPEVRVNGVAPGPVLLPASWPPEEVDRTIRTTPLARLGSPADVVGAIRYLLASSYVTGTTLVVDGGWLGR